MRLKRKQNKKFFATVLLLILLGLFYLPAGTLADTVGGTPSSSKLVPCGGPTDPCTLCHLIVGFHNLVQYGLYWVITFALVGIFISGLMYIISSGDEGMITKAKGFMKASLIGFVVVAGAWMIVNTTILVLGGKDSTATDMATNPGAGTMGINIVNWYTFTCNTTSSVSSTAGSAGTPAGGCCVVRPGVCNSAASATTCSVGTYRAGACSTVTECSAETCGTGGLGFCSYSGYGFTLICPTGYSALTGSALSGGRNCPISGKCCR